MIMTNATKLAWNTLTAEQRTLYFAAAADGLSWVEGADEATRALLFDFEGCMFTEARGDELWLVPQFSGSPSKAAYEEFYSKYQPQRLPDETICWIAASATERGAS